jgi:hypothetical protein
LFTVTGLRQALAMGVCMIAFVVMDAPENSAKWAKISRGVLAFLLVYLASLFHESAAIFIVVLLIYLLNKKITGLSYVPYIILVIMARLIQPFVIEIINEMFKSDQEAEVTLGLNFVFLIVLAIAIIICYYIEPKDAKLLKRQGIEVEKPDAFYGLCIRILLVGIAFYIMLSGSTLLRGAMYFTLFLIPAVPNAINRLDKGEKVLVNIVFAVFLMIFFYMNALKPATFKICPYEFFWQ